MKPIFKDKKLTEKDVRALNEASRIVFRYSSETEISQIECIKENSSIVTPQIHIIPVRNRLTLYSSDVDIVEGCYINDSAEYDPVLRTIFHNIKVGDILKLHWIADNNSNNIRKNNLHADELQIQIIRDHTPLLFNLAYSVCYDNSVRMIKLKVKEN